MTTTAHPRRAARLGLAGLALLVAAALLVAQGPGQQSQAPPKEKEKEAKKEEKPRGRIFTGKIALRSSRQESETASYGFKGVGEDGRVQQAALATQPSGTDHSKLAQLAAYKLPREELHAFLRASGLHSRETEAKP